MDEDYIRKAMGFLHPDHENILRDLYELYNTFTDHYKTSVECAYSVGDMRTGQSLVTYAIREGRKVTKEIDLYLIDNTNLK